MFNLPLIYFSNRILQHKTHFSFLLNPILQIYDNFHFEKRFFVKIFNTLHICTCILTFSGQTNLCDNFCSLESSFDLKKVLFIISIYIYFCMFFVFFILNIIRLKIYIIRLCNSNKNTQKKNKRFLIRLRKNKSWYRYYLSKLL